MQYTPENESNSNNNSQETWNNWINQRHTYFKATKEWYNENLDNDTINLNNHENNKNFLDNLINKIDSENYKDILLNLYVYSDKYIFKGNREVIYGYYTRKKIRDIPSGVYFNTIIPVDTDIKSKIKQKNELVYVGKITIGELNNPDLIEEITHNDMRDENDIQNPSVCSNINYNRQKPLTTKKLFTPKFKSDKGAEFGPDATCNKIYTECNDDSTSKEEKIKKISDKYCTPREAINKDECENTGNSICSSVILEDMKNLTDEEKDEKYKDAKNRCNNLRYTDDEDDEYWKNYNVCSWNGANNQCERRVHNYQSKYGVNKLCEYKEPVSGYITTTPAQCNPIRENIEKIVDSCHIKKQKCEKILACQTDSGLPEGLPRFLRPLDIKYFKRETAPVPMCCARSFKAVSKNVMNINYFVKIFNYQTTKELKNELENSRTSVDYQKYMIEVHKEREAKLKDQLKNMPKLSKEDEHFFSHMSLGIQKVLNEKINLMVKNFELQSNDNLDDMPNISQAEKSWWETIASGLKTTVLLPYKGLKWVIKTIIYLIKQGFDLIGWVLRNQAMTMLLFSLIKQFKDGCCKWISNKWYGEEIVEVGLVGAAASSAAQKLSDITYFKGFLMNNIWKWVSTKEGFSAIWDNSAKLLSSAATWGLGIATGGVGFAASGAIGNALSVGFGMAKGAISDTVTMYAEMKILSNVGKEALDIIVNWQSCIYKRIQEKLTLRGVTSELKKGFQIGKSMTSGLFGGSHFVNEYRDVLEKEKEFDNNSEKQLNRIFTYKNTYPKKFNSLIKQNNSQEHKLVVNTIDKYDKQNLNKREKNKLFNVFASVYNNTPRSEYTKNHLKLMMLVGNNVYEFYSN